MIGPVFLSVVLEALLKKYKILLGLALLLSAGVCQAQYARPYLVAAAMDVAVDAQADIWLNGIHIAHCSHTPMGTGYKRIAARPDSLCYFKKNNLIAIRLQGGRRGDGFIGVAYAFWFKLSDGTYRVIHSASTQEHRCLYLPDFSQGEPVGWQETAFDDSSWVLAKSSGDMIPNTATLPLNRQSGMAGFLTASHGYQAQYSGEKQLFRRSFTLDISTNPRCLPASSLAPSNRYLSAYSETKPQAGPVRAITPQVLTVHQQPLQAAPQLEQPQPSFQWFTRPVENQPTAVPTEVVYSPSGSLSAPSRPTPPVYSPPVSTPTLIVQNDGAIVFGVSNANILVTFGDGPGFYKVEAVDGNLNHLKTLLNQRVISASDMWLSWDGKDDAGKDVPLGRYYVLCSKEGLVLQKIILRRIP
jgi:hypothetical protein